MKDDPGIPLLKPQPKQVPLGFSSPARPVMVDQIKLAKDGARYE